eukprot:2499194-Amphidinium_carterae.1
MKLEGSHVLLTFSWLTVTMFGPCLPILNTLIALLTNIYSILLFGSNAQLLGSDADLLDMSTTQVREARLPSFGFSVVALLALVLQLSSLL